MNYLKKKKRPQLLLEIGCGNGWLSAMMATLANSKVVGRDINSAELNQATRVFDNRRNLTFELGDLDDINSDMKFDIIVFAASVQYFPLISKTIKKALSLLNPAGEIHILDSHFYNMPDLEEAKKRSLIHYKSIDNQEMPGFYFHHSWDSLNEFQTEILFDPSSLKNKISFNKDPFPWIRITSE
jgi:ubiquinone/menaquinone biosynthesis C-methylase UbiE